MALRLARRGFDTFCFDYPSTGDSDGDSSNFSIASSILSLERLVQYAISEMGLDKLSMVGMRLGAAIALEVSEQIVSESLFLIDPILDGSVYLKQLRNMQHDSLYDNPYEPPFLNNQSSLEEVLGYPLAERLVDELMQLAPNIELAQSRELVLLESENQAGSLLRLSQQHQDQGKQVRYIQSPNEFHWSDWRYNNMQILPRSLLQKLESYFMGESQ